MLRFGLVLLVATSALAAPRYNTYEEINLVVAPLNEVGVAKNTGASNHLTDGLFSMIDGGDTNAYTITLNNIINDMAALPDKTSQGLALAQAVTTMLAQATGVPGDTCVAAALINAFASGNYRQALSNYVNHISRNLDLLLKLKNNPQAARFASGPTSSCNGGGRIYNFEAAWNAVIDSSTQSSAGLINEQYCIAKRLYNALNVRSNNIAAVFTASSLPPVARVFNQVQRPLANFVSAVLGNGNPSSSLSALQQALAQAAQRA